jgi:hypothetical protein
MASPETAPLSTDTAPGIYVLRADANAVPATVPGPDGKPVPFNPLKNVAFHALSHGYALGYLICGIAALLTLAAVQGRVHETLLDPRTLADG